MKYSKLNFKYASLALLTLFIASCTHDDAGASASISQEVTIRLSVKDEEKGSTRANDWLDMEKIKRYDIFIYDSTTGALDEYFTGNDSGGRETVSVSFVNDSRFATDKKVYAVVNYDFDGKSAEAIKALPAAELEALTTSVPQHLTGTKDALLSFSGYRRMDDGATEPFVMSYYCLHNFAAKPYLTLPLRRTYSKVVLRFKSTLPASETVWNGLHSFSIDRIDNVPDEGKIFGTTGMGYQPALSSYVYSAGAGVLRTVDTDIQAGSYIFDLFVPDNAMCLKIPAHDPSGDKNKRSSLGLTFTLGSADGTTVSKTFERTVFLGTEENGYRIDPNSAYLITVWTSKTDDNFSVSLETVPWNYAYFDNEVYPN